MKYQINNKKYLSDNELKHFTEMLENDWSRNALLFKTSLATGGRAQEILNITGHDLDDNDHTVFIRGLKGSMDRAIPIKERLYIALKELAKEDLSERLFPISYERFKALWYQYRPVPKKLHCLRHTFAMKLFKHTRDLLLVKAALGHASIQSTLVYNEHYYQNEKLKEVLFSTPRKQAR